MGPNYGLMSTMANGIKEGMLSYQTQQQIQRQQGVEDLLRGVQKNPDTGAYEYTPQKQAEVDFGKQKMAHEKSLLDTQTALENANSPQSQIAIQNYKNLYGKDLAPGTTGQQAQGLLNATGNVYKADMGFKGKQESIQAASDRQDKNLDYKNNNPSAASGAQGIRQDAITARATGKITGDSLLNGFKNQANSIDKGQRLLNDPDKPVSITVAHEILQDYANALSGAKGGGSDYKLKSISPKMLEEMEGNFMTLIKSDPNQPAPKAQVQFLKDMGARLSETYDKQIENRANTFGVGLEDTYKHTPQAVSAVNSMIKAHKGGGWRSIGQEPVVSPQDQGASQGLIQATSETTRFGQDVLDYAKAHNITPEQANAIKVKRGGK